MSKTLLLWDIDGTLIDSGGAGGRALILSLERGFGIKDDLAWLDYYGRTDVWIAKVILTHHGLPGDAANVTRFLEGYLTALSEELHNPHARCLPGVEEILATASRRSDITQGLLTGNLVRGAKIKLGHLGLNGYFDFGAYADDSELRNDLSPLAYRRGCAHARVDFPLERVFVIGDTPHDIECGRVIGARTIAVATGKHSVDELKIHRPHLLYSDLSQAAAFIFKVST